MEDRYFKVFYNADLTMIIRPDKRHGNLRLQKFVVVALGFERVCF